MLAVKMYNAVNIHSFNYAKNIFAFHLVGHDFVFDDSNIEMHCTKYLVFLIFDFSVTWAKSFSLT